MLHLRRAHKDSEGASSPPPEILPNSMMGQTSPGLDGIVTVGGIAGHAPLSRRAVKESPPSSHDHAQRALSDKEALINIAASTPANSFKIMGLVGRMDSLAPLPPDP